MKGKGRTKIKRKRVKEWKEGNKKEEIMKGKKVQSEKKD